MLGTTQLASDIQETACTISSHFFKVVGCNDSVNFASVQMMHDALSAARRRAAASCAIGTHVSCVLSEVCLPPALPSGVHRTWGYPVCGFFYSNEHQEPMQSRKSEPGAFWSRWQRYCNPPPEHGDEVMRIIFPSRRDARIAVLSAIR